MSQIWLEWKYKSINNGRRNKKATNTELKAEQGNIEKVKTYDLSIFIGET